MGMPKYNAIYTGGDDAVIGIKSGDRIKVFAISPSGTQYSARDRAWIEVPNGKFLINWEDFEWNDDPWDIE